MVTNSQLIESRRGSFSMTGVTVRLYTLAELKETSDVGYTQAMERMLEDEWNRQHPPTEGGDA